MKTGKQMCLCKTVLDLPDFDVVFFKLKQSLPAGRLRKVFIMVIMYMAQYATYKFTRDVVVDNFLVCQIHNIVHWIDDQ